MKISEYLNEKYGIDGAATLLAKEARILGIRYPLVHGWREIHGDKKITRESALKLIEVLKNSTSKYSPKGIEILERITSSKWQSIRLSVLISAGNRCHCCGASAKTSELKVVPVVRDGELTESNLQVLCEECADGIDTIPDGTDFR